MSLKFYADERARWSILTAKCEWVSRKVPGTEQVIRGHRFVIRRRAYLAHGRMGSEEAEVGIRRLASAHDLCLKGVVIGFTCGNRHSSAGRNSITINLYWADWLTIAHEVAHTYWYRKLSIESRQGHVKHGRRLAKIIDRFCGWIVEQGWHEGALAHEVAMAEVARARLDVERERLAAMPEPVEARVARRRAQVKRLETKVKSLTTRLKRARRSLSALERSAGKAAEAATVRS